MMKRYLLIAVLAFFSATAAYGQTGIYITSSSIHPSNVATGSVLTNGSYQEQYTSFWTSGIGGGVTLNFIPGPIKIGFDFRGSTRSGTVGADTAMGGIKVAFNPPLLHIKPYIQGSGGYVATRTVNISTSPSNPSQTVGGTFTNRYAAWEILGGVDVPLIHFVDFRVIELGGGKGTGILGSAGAPSLSLFTINTGVVLHF